MKFDIRHKVSLLTVGLVVITAVLVASIYFDKTNVILTENTLENLSSDIAHESKRLTVKVDKLKKDTLFLSQMPDLRDHIEHRKSDTWYRHVTGAFNNMMQLEPDYLQIRLIDKHGREVIRLERNNGKIHNVNKPSLQNKSNSPYVKETLKLTDGQLFLSEINLNRERDEITIPYTPVLRASTPIFDDSELYGLVVINLDFGKELQKITANYSGKAENIFITDNQGSYLVHPQTHKLFGDELGNKYRVQEDYPQVSTLFLPGEKTDRKTILPDKLNSEAVVFVRVPLVRENGYEHFISIGLSKNYDEIISNQYLALMQSSIFVIILVIVTALLALWFSKLLTQPLQAITTAVNNFQKGYKQAPLPMHRNDEIGILARNFNEMFSSVESAQKNLEDMNTNLESQVRQRTEELSRFKSTLDKTLDCVFMFEPETLKFFYVNVGAMQQVGYSYDELIHMTPYDITPQFSESQFREVIAPMLSGEIETLSFESVLQNKNFFLVPVDVFLQYINPVNEHPRFVAFVRDITERKKIDQMKNEFISTVSHELRTPLTSIRGSLGLLTGGAIGQTEEQGKALLDIANKNTERLLLLINDILDISKIESGKMEFNYAEINLCDFLKNAIEANADYGKQYHISFELHDCPENVKIYADEDRLLQVMNNLMSNAAKFSPAQSTVSLSAEKINDKVCVYVKDQGTGIPEEFRNTIFERFVQADSSDTRQAGGTGLGLNITQAIIKKLNGQIDFTTERGKGTTFYFSLPICQDTSLTSASGSATNSKTSTSILICEDDPDIAELLRVLLEHHGYAADIAYSANEVRKLLAQNHYQAMTLDIMLPDESGITLFKEIRANPATQDLPIIVISAIADEARKQLNGGAIDVVDWLTKPIDQNRLIADMDTIFNSGINGMPKILHVEDEDDVITYVKVLLANKANVTAARSVDVAKKALQADTYDLILLDIGLPDGTGFDLLPEINKLEPLPPLVIFSAQDINTKLTHQFNDVLVKSRASHEQLFNTIVSCLETRKKVKNI